MNKMKINALTKQEKALSKQRDIAYRDMETYQKIWASLVVTIESIRKEIENAKEE